jgi:hypothetical protein
VVVNRNKVLILQAITSFTGNDNTHLKMARTGDVNEKIKTLLRLTATIIKSSNVIPVICVSITKKIHLLLNRETIAS